jgi:tetratricopeptide (TPR) repeat protein
LESKRHNLLTGSVSACLFSVLCLVPSASPGAPSAFAACEASPVARPSSTTNSNPRTLQDAFRAGQEALARGDLQQAENDFSQVLKWDPSDAGAHANLGVIQMRRHNWGRALTELKAAQQLAPNVPGIRLNIALVYFQEADYRAAIVPLESVIHDEPNSVQPSYLLGLCYFLTERYSQALSILKLLWAGESHNLSYLYILSIAADKTHDRLLEDRAAARMLQVGENSPEVRLLIGKADLTRLANQSAVTELKSAAEADPRLPFVHFYLGIAYRRLNEFAQAKLEFSQDLSVDPDVAYTYDELGDVCSYLGQEQEAKEYFRKALRLNTRLASSYYGLAKIDFQEKRYSQAWSVLANAGRLDPHSASVHYLRGEILLGMGRRAESQSEFKIAARMQKTIRDQLLREISGAKVPNPELKTEE